MDIRFIISLEKNDLISRACCWIHARRPFADFIKFVVLSAAKGSIAQEAYDRITELLHIDNDFDDLSASNRKKQRQLLLSEKVDAYFMWVKQKYVHG